MIILNLACVFQHEMVMSGYLSSSKTEKEGCRRINWSHYMVTWNLFEQFLIWHM